MREVLKDTGMVLDYPAFALGDSVGVVGFNGTYRVKDYWFDVLDDRWRYRLLHLASHCLFEYPEDDLRAVATPTLKTRGGSAAKEQE